MVSLIYNSAITKYFNSKHIFLIIKYYYSSGGGGGATGAASTLVIVFQLVSFTVTTVAQTGTFTVYVPLELTITVSVTVQPGVLKVTTTSPGRDWLLVILPEKFQEPNEVLVDQVYVGATCCYSQ